MPTDEFFTQLDENTAPAHDDIFASTDDVAGLPVTKKVKHSNFYKSLFAPATEKTVSVDVLTVDQNSHKVQPESGTADDIATITGMPTDTFLILYPSDDGVDTLTFKHGTGNISCPGSADIPMVDGGLIFYYDGTTVFLLSGSPAAAAATGGNPLRIMQSMPPSANAATIDYRPGGSTPAEQFMVFDFDDTTAEYMDFKCRLLGYNGGGLTFKIAWSSADQTTGAVQWEIAIRAIPSDTEDVDGSHTYLFNTVSTTTASATGEVVYSEITFTNGDDMDNWADGEFAIVRVRRNPAGTDTMTNDAELHALFGKES